MIRIIGAEGSEEFSAAQRLRDLIVEAWPGVDTDQHDDIRIVAGAKCYGQTTTDIDLVVFVLLAKLRPMPHAALADAAPNVDPIFIRSLCLTIELKSHQPDKVIFDGNQVTVFYGERRHQASEQAQKQQVALRRFYEQHGMNPPFVTDLIWLSNVPKECLPDVMSNIIGAQATWGDILRSVVALGRPWPKRVAGVREINAFSYTNVTQTTEIINLLSKRLEMSKLDRIRVDRITRRHIGQSQAPQYIEKMGKQLLIFRGRGGTGKTIRLLQLAYDMYIKQDARVLILTYNKALVADLQRLFVMINAGDGATPRAIIFKTVHAFLYQIVKHLGSSQTHLDPFIPQIAQHTQQALHHLRKANLQNQQPLDALIAAAPEHFDWDYIFVDESQDWPADERDLLFALYDFRRFVVADGVDQMVRGAQHINWRQVIASKDSQVVTFSKSLRLKAGLCQFAQAFALHLNLPNWNLEPDADLYGGRVIILEGPYSADRSFHDELVQTTQAAHNYPIDMLFCVPPALVKHRDHQKVHSLIADQLQAWDYRVWDGAADHVRSNYPLYLDQIRIVQYDSCRGLEAWSSINLGFDELYDYKRRQYTPPAQSTLFSDDDREAHYFAARWLMIPLTRAIDTLVIQIRSLDHPIAQALKAAAQECPSVVEWRKSPTKRGKV
ncbi:hypothetical protein [Candidatus Viridilinea mediisalina]|uniref:Uncharacterized protein n=1 Tax=Candidatus Viridilinea mediisalina TaxID=2024553 RepID=A0A2A6RNW9_9CHLR|nr:hypothetical protein [Candidatus Viridilinea mediisalina]PDW04643.1 hypothetical protein CJ255_02380 [Candidatus Viridilinea mediisalina]